MAECYRARHSPLLAASQASEYWNLGPLKCTPPLLALGRWLQIWEKIQPKGYGLYDGPRLGPEPGLLLQLFSSVGVWLWLLTACSQISALIKYNMHAKLIIYIVTITGLLQVHPRSSALEWIRSRPICGRCHGEIHIFRTDLPGNYLPNVESIIRKLRWWPASTSWQNVSKYAAMGSLWWFTGFALRSAATGSGRRSCTAIIHIIFSSIYVLIIIINNCTAYQITPLS